MKILSEFLNITIEMEMGKVIKVAKQIFAEFEIEFLIFHKSSLRHKSLF